MHNSVSIRKPLHIGRADELTGKDRALYRALEILPGALSWGSIVGCVVLSYFAPVYAAIFIIVFDFYWLLKTIYLSTYLRQNWRRLKHNRVLDWMSMLGNFKHEHIYHLILLPYYKEDALIIDHCLQSLVSSRYDKKKFLVALATEERAGEGAKRIAENAQKRYGAAFGDIIITVHPRDVSGEIIGKGSNIAYSIEESRKLILDAKKIPYGDVIVSAFDIDTVVYPDYFGCVTWHFLASERPYRTSFQPVPLYNNNIWDAPALSRVVATSGTFWQMIQQERPEKIATFSSHSVSFKALHDIGYWQKNMVSEDSRIFWNAFFAYDGDYVVTPISYPISMDANLAPTFWRTLVNIYKQQRRWGWGVENVPYILFGLLKNRRIPFRKKIQVAFTQLEGFWSLATNPIIIFILGWLPLVLGGPAFNTTVLSYNLPTVTRNLMIFAMLGLVFSAIVSISFLPKRPPAHRPWKFLFLILQWILIPITITVFGAVPGLDAQTRLMFGRYMGFWVTPKHLARKI